MHKIAILVGLQSYHQLNAPHNETYWNAIAEAAPGWQVDVIRDKSRVEEQLANSEILFGWSGHVAKYCLKPGSPLRWIQTWSAGVDKLPLQELARRNILLTNAGGVHTHCMAETGLALLLGLGRGLRVAGADQQQSKWNHESESYTRLRELHGQTIGILGTGHIGAEIARLCKAFGMMVLGCSRSGKAHSGTEAYFDGMFTLGTIDAMLPRCDAVLNVLPLTNETYGIMNAQMFALMPKNSLYVSIGRGPSTVTADLAAALQSGHLAGAGLDVTDPEPLPQESPLWRMENVIILPHVGGLTNVYLDRLMGVFLPNLKAFIAGKEPAINRIDYSREY